MRVETLLSSENVVVVKVQTGAQRLLLETPGNALAIASLQHQKVVVHFGTIRVMQIVPFLLNK